MTKKETDLTKGIAVLMMIFHHLFNNAERFTVYGFEGLIINAEITRSIANDFKVCVPVFAFLSGYGMLIRIRNEDRKAEIKHIPAMMQQSWKSYLKLIKDTTFLTAVMILVSVIFRLPKSPSDVWGASPVSIAFGIITNMTCTAHLFRTGWFVSSWWYLKVAVLFIFLFPAVYYIYRKLGWICLMLISVIIIPFVLDMNVKNDTFWRYFPSFILGMITADKSIIEAIISRAHRSVRNIIITGVLFCAAFSFSIWLKHHLSLNFIIQALQAFLVVFACTAYISKVPYLSEGLYRIGRNSKYMWLIHVYLYGQIFPSLLFGLRNIWLIFGTLVLVTYIVALVLYRCLQKLQSGMGWGNGKINND